MIDFKGKIIGIFTESQNGRIYVRRTSIVLFSVISTIYILSGDIFFIVCGAISLILTMLISIIDDAKAKRDLVFPLPPDYKIGLDSSLHQDGSSYIPNKKEV